MQLLDSPEALAAIEPQWQSLWERDPRATPFQSPAWLLPWTRRLWGGGRIRTLALWSERRLVGLAPFFSWGYGTKPEIVRISFLGCGITDYLDILCAPGLEAECGAAVVDSLWRSRREWHLCDLQELRPDSPLLPHVPEAAPSSVCPVADLPPTTEEYLASLPAKFRTDLRRAENRLRSHGVVEFRTGVSLLDDLFRLHAARWSERNDQGVLEAPRLQAFHREAAERLHGAGMLRIYGLFLDRECLAVQYNFAAKRRAYAYLSGFDPAWSKFSPGSILLKHSICEAIREGIGAFDFLRKAEDFKHLWGAKDRLNRRILIHAEEAGREHRPTQAA